MVPLEKETQSGRPVAPLPPDLTHQRDHLRRDLEVNHSRPTAAVPEPRHPFGLETLPPLRKGGPRDAEIAAGGRNVLGHLLVREHAGPLLHLLFGGQGCSPSTGHGLLQKPGSGATKCSGGVLSATAQPAGQRRPGAPTVAAHTTTILTLTAGPVHDPERAPADGAAGLQPAVPLVCRPQPG